MSGLLRRLTRRRAATADETRPIEPEASEPAAAPAETPAEPGGERRLAAVSEPPPSEQATELLSPTGEQPPAAAQPIAEVPGTAGRDLPAGVDRAEFEDAPAASARRGKLRRRLRYLRRVRELLLRDLGGFTYEVHRSAGGILRESHRRLVEAKTGRLAALDTEVRELEARLDEAHAETVLREPGIGGTCPECGELHSSDAHYCSRCGEPLDAKALAQREAAIREAAQPTATTAHPTPEPKAASVLWAAGPKPQAGVEVVVEPPDARSATSEWITGEHKPAAAPPEPKPDEAAVAADEKVESRADEAVADVKGEDEAAAAASDEPPADEAAAPASDEPPADETAAEPDPGPPAKDAGGDERPAGNPYDSDRNGRQEDGRPSLTSGDPLGSPGERP